MLAKRLHKLARYLRAAPLPHLSALAAGAASWGLGAQAGAAWEAEAWHLAVGCGLLSGPLAVGAVLAEADARGRYHEYRRVKDLLARFGGQARLFRPLAASRCQRDAARLAAAETGCLTELSAFFRARGYRWYHLLPDYVAADPLRLLERSFWRATFRPKRGRRRP